MTAVIDVRGDGMATVRMTTTSHGSAPVRAGVCFPGQEGGVRPRTAVR